MGPAHAGVSGQRRTVQRVYDWSVSVALGVSLLLGAVLGQSTLAGGKHGRPRALTGFFPSPGQPHGPAPPLRPFAHRSFIRPLAFPLLLDDRPPTPRVP